MARSKPELTLDDQLLYLRPLTPELIARLCGYASGGNQFSSMRRAKILIPPERLRDLATFLRTVADRAESLAKRGEAAEDSK